MRNRTTPTSQLQERNPRNEQQDPIGSATFSVAVEAFSIRDHTIAFFKEYRQRKHYCKQSVEGNHSILAGNKLAGNEFSNFDIDFL
jgi:hypothetical protein